MDLTVVLFVAAGIVAAVTAVQGRSLLAAAVALLAFAHVV